MDWGEKRIGIAISDEGGRVAMPLKVVNRDSILVEIEMLRKIYGDFIIVLGLPVRTDGVQGGASEREALKLKKEIEKRGFKVNLWKEWYSSAEAERLLKICELSARKRRRERDRISAALILEAFLRSVNRNEG
ncbi:MAG: Holliday junction resolvase RuvX [Synergistetes bacterium]|nr:Holliday junction resolvase RuvX [Synergistota bacterium]